MCGADRGPELTECGSQGGEGEPAGWWQRGRASQRMEIRERRRNQRRKGREGVEERGIELEQKSLIKRKRASKRREAGGVGWGGGGIWMSKFGCFNGLTCLQPPVSCSLWGHSFCNTTESGGGFVRRGMLEAPHGSQESGPHSPPSQKQLPSPPGCEL